MTLDEAIRHCDEVILNLKLKENCDECLKQHEQLKKWLIEYKNLIKEHFELVEKVEWLKEEMTEPAFNLVFGTREFLHSWYKGIQTTSAENAILQRKLSYYENPQPYKLEDLHERMWVFDNDEFHYGCNLILMIEIENKRIYLIDYEGNTRWVNFEKGRFFPITKAICKVNEKGIER